MADARSDANLPATLLGLLGDRVTPQQYQRWFRALQVESAPDGVIIVGAPNGFVAEWLEGYYRDVIEQCVEEVAGPGMRVDIVKSETPQSTGSRPRRRTIEEVRRDAGRGSGRSSGRAPDGRRTIEGARDGVEQRRQNRKRRTGSGALSAPRSPVSRSPASRSSTSRSSTSPWHSTFAPSGSDLFGHPRYRNFLSDVILNEDYIFENFVKGPSNQLAHAAATAVSNRPGDAYNPLFLHGSVGLGKTHLLQAICTKFLQKNPDARVIYLSCESFVNQFIAAVGEGQIKDFRYRYRHVDMLLIDDIHFLAKKERTQEEFFHTFNTLYNSKKQIVLSCDSPPVEIPTLEDRLVSRFKWGLVAAIESPDHETRVSIVRKKAERRGIELPDDAALYIADHITANVRELEGAVLRVCSYASLTGNPVTLELTQESLRDLVRTKERKVSIETILRVVADQFAVKVSELTGKRRHKSISHPRQIAMYLARRLTQYSLVEIGGQFGGRDHTTVIYANEKVARELETNPRLREDLEMLVRRIRSGA